MSSKVTYVEGLVLSWGTISSNENLKRWDLGGGSGTLVACVWEPLPVSLLPPLQKAISLALSPTLHHDLCASDYEIDTTEPDGYGLKPLKWPK